MFWQIEWMYYAHVVFMKWVGSFKEVSIGWGNWVTRRWARSDWCMSLLLACDFPIMTVLEHCSDKSESLFCVLDCVFTWKDVFVIRILCWNVVIG
jgi:hypothetical protein